MLPSTRPGPTAGVSTEAGILEMDERMKSGRLKVAAHLSEWFEEYRFYHRKDGQIVKIKDDLMSATRIAVMMKRFGRAVLLGSVVPAPQHRRDRRRHRLRRVHRHMPDARPIPHAAVDDLGLGDMLAEQVSGETEEMRKKRMAEMPAEAMLGPAGSLAVTSLFGMPEGCAGGGY
jgi:hypothetical protein